MNTTPLVRLLMIAGCLLGQCALGQPTAAQRITGTRVFDQPLTWVGQPPDETDSQALWLALDSNRSLGHDAILAALESFVAARPNSPWTPSLRANLGKYYREHGRYTPALRHWEAAWTLTRDYPEGGGKQVADFTFAHWTRLLASLGRKDTLTALYAETKGRTFDRGPLQQIINATREGYAKMVTTPAVCYRCGTFALNNVGHALQVTNTNFKTLINYPSPDTGFSMGVLAGLSDRFKLGLVPVQRPAGDLTLVVPAVVHWRQNHYAAVVAVKGDNYEVVDPTFGQSLWLKAAAINAEASGNFMVPASQIPAGWRPLAGAESGLIFGKGVPNWVDDEGDEGCGNGGSGGGGGDPMDYTGPKEIGARGSENNCNSCKGTGGGGMGVGPGGGGIGPDGFGGGGSGRGGGDSCPTCDSGSGGGFGGGGAARGSIAGMPVWRVSEPYITLFLSDEPLGYQPQRGPRISFSLFYKQRETSPVTTKVFSVGPLWNFNLLSHVEDTSPGLSCSLRAAGGGTRNYKPDGQTPHFYSNTRMQRLTDASTNLTGFQLLKDDGSIGNYGLVVTGLLANPLVFLTERITGSGQTNRYLYNYDPTNNVVLLSYLVDADGRTNTFTYDTNFTAQISQVTDPFGRATALKYDANGYLTNITDVAGISSSFLYETNGWITNLTTPYGVTTFQLTGTGTALGGDNEINRSALVTDPVSAKYLFLYRDDSTFLDSTHSVVFLPNDYTNSMVPTNTPIGTLDNVYIPYRNSWSWGPKQYSSLSTNNMRSFTTNDYLRGRLSHWLHGGFGVDKTLSIRQESSVDGTTRGQMTWFDYDGKTESFREGTQSQPGAIVRVLPDLTTWYVWYQRDGWGRATNVISTYASGTNVLTRTNTYVYSTNGVDLLTVTGPTGVTEAGYGYNASHQVTAFTNAVGYVTTYTYDSNGRLTSMVSPTGLTTTNIYGGDGWLSKVINLEINSTNSYTYTNGLVYSSTDAHGLTITNTYDALQRLISTTFPDGTYSSNRYTYLDLTAAKDRLGNWSYAGYNGVRQRVTQTNALGRVTLFTYCECGALETITDALTNIVTMAYDLNGRLLRTLYPDGSYVTNVYNVLGQRTAVGDTAGNWTTNTYNHQGLLMAVSNAFGQVMSAAYDIEDRATNSVNANNVIITSSYDDLGRLLTRTYPDGGVEKFGYSAFGVASYTNQLNYVTSYGYDVAGRKTAETNANSEVVRYSYSAAGDLLTLVDSKSQTNRWNYDLYGRTTNKLDAAGAEIFRYQYDANSRLTNRWSAAKGNTTYAYDAVGNLTGTTYPVSPGLTLAYDALNRLTNLVDAVGTTKYGYTSFGALASEDGPWTNDTVSYGYNNLRLRSSLSLQQPNASAWAQTYGYDAAQRLQTISAPPGTFTYDFQTVGGLIKKLSLPNSSYITNTFDSVGRLTGTHLKNSGNSTLNSHTYGYNAGSQRTNTARTDGSKVDYTYDAIGQLKTATGRESDNSARLQEKFGYLYDAAGNLNNRTNNALVQTFNVNNLNQLTTNTRSGTLTVAGTTSAVATNVTVNALTASRYGDNTFAREGFSLVDGDNTFTAVAQDSYGRSDTNSITVTLPATVTFQYDANGNLLSDGKRAFDWDDENQLIKITVTNAWKSEFTYDGKLRRRIRKEFTWQSSAWVLTNEVRYVYDGNLVIQERDGNNQPTVTYTHGRDLSGGLQGAGGIGGLLARSDSASQTVVHYHADGNGNVTALVNAQQVLVAKYLYDPFGNTLSASGPLAEANLYRFSSKEFHANSGLIYYLYRYYDPNLQRWLNRDPIEEKGGLLLYAFINNNPVNGYDADGRVGQIVGGAIVGCAVNAGWSLFTSYLSGDNACQCTCKAFGSCGVGAIAGAIAAANPAWSKCMIGFASGVSSKFVGDACNKACGKADPGKPICSLISGIAQAIMGCAMPGSGDVSAVERTIMEMIVKVGGSDLKQFCNIVHP